MELVERDTTTMLDSLFFKYSKSPCMGQEIDVGIENSCARVLCEFNFRTEVHTF